MRTGTILLLLFILTAYSTETEEISATANPQAEINISKENIQKDSSAAIDAILSKMSAATKNLTSCQASLSYLVVQDPELLDSRTLQNGMLYYQKTDADSKLRIHFDDIKQDDFEPVKQIEEYLFDGVWLTRINFKLEQVDVYQQAPEDKPIGVFDLISHNVPLIGFSDVNDINNNFDVELAPKTADPNESVCLLLKVKEGSDFEKDYTKINIWLDKNLYLPEKVVAYTPQGDEYHIGFKYIQVNKKLKNTVFDVETPTNFRKNIEQLKKEP